MDRTLPKALRLAAPLVLLALGACQGSGQGGAFASLRGSPAGVPIALEVMDGPPAPVRTALTQELVTAASARQVELAGAAAPARYRVRGYLSTETDAEGGLALAYVWDVFDAEKRRATRLTGSSPLRTAAADPWGDIDQDTIAKLAGRSMDEIAAFLTETKTAVAAAPAAAPESAAATPALAYAAQ
ncbi:MAG TPA: hypothetical protein VHL98_08050 [Microvirga sp.]|jgi:hypothetical protein|nr:hypothetical protein [Microvirga sp.]